MSTKTQNVKNFIKETGTNNQLFVFAGYNPNPTITDSTQSSIELWNYSDFSVRVGQNSLIPVTPYVKWVEKKPYNSWSSTGVNTGNYYAYNDQNGYVYLCISNNEDNRSDISGQNVSNIRPTHTAGIQKYNDGYSWKPLYKVTPSIERFVTSSWLPVVSFDLFDNSSQRTLNQQTKRFCKEGAIGTEEIGKCAIYAKVPLNTDDDAGSTEFQAGDLFTVAEEVSCARCFYMMYQNDKFISVFYENSDVVPNTTIVSENYDLITSLIESSEITTSSPYYYLHEINQNDGLDDGAIVSAFIDLSGFSRSQLVANVENPEFTITSNSGVGGRIRLKTTKVENTFIISGIEVLSPGSYYKDITLDIDPLAIEMDVDMLLSVIDVNLDTIDGLGFDPVTILKAEHVMIDSRIEKKILEDSSIIIPDKLNFFGLVQNPTSLVGTNEITSGSNYNKKADIVYRTTVKAKIVNNTAAQLPEPEETFDVPEGIEVGPVPPPDITSSTVDKVLIGGVGEVGLSGPSFVISAELKNVAYSKASYLVGTSLDGDKSDNQISQILATPEFVQYTGKILTSKKLNSDLPISDVDSVIIRINMVKGM
jgi:hypothetical protein